MDWKRWIGLPHRFGADPELGEAADCLLMVWLILDEAGIEHPEFDHHWLELAKQERWRELEGMWADATVQLQEPEEHAVALFRNGPAGLGVGIVVDDQKSTRWRYSATALLGWASVSLLMTGCCWCITGAASIGCRFRTCPRLVSIGSGDAAF